MYIHMYIYTYVHPPRLREGEQPGSPHRHAVKIKSSNNIYL